MKSVRFLAATALASASFVAMPSIAFAQDAAAPAEAEDVGSAIIVTGSRIRRPNLESTVPVTSVTGEELFETGTLSVGDQLNDLPQLRSTYSQQNSTRFLGTRGLNLLDLRGLGTARTLVLVNGRRHVASDILVNGVSPDVNTFPTQLIERIDIVTGGASSIYGSDAIAGVVNFVLKQDYDGAEVRGQSGISRYGDAGNQYLAVLAGKNFADGRGNIAINLEYAHTDRYYGSNRPNLRQNDGFVTVDTDVATDPFNADSTPDRLFYRDIRSSTISLGGQLGLAQSRANPACGTDTLGNPFTCGYLFQPDGSIIAQTGTRVGLSPNGNYVGGNGYSGREGQLLTLTPQLDRYAINLIGHFEISPAFVPFIEAKYVRSEAFGSVSGPFFTQGATLADSLNRERVRLDNPYLSPAVRTQLTTAILATGVDPNSAATTPAALTAAQRTAIANGSFRLSLRRNWLDLGIRDEKFRRETYRIVAGVRGEFNDDWSYELSANYGDYKERNVIQSNVNRQRYLLAVDSVFNPATNSIVCRSQIDPTAIGTDRAGNAAVLAADVAACVPLNPFGVGSVSDAAKKYLTITSEATGKITQFVASGSIAGDLSQLFELPGGPIGFAIGAEYRRETNSYDLDDTTQAGYAFYNAIPSFTSPAFEVKEAFAEIRVPIVKDVPLLRELTATGSIRVASYKGATGTVYAYSGGIDWRPINDLHIRGAYSRSVRAPTLSDLFSAQSQNFTPAPNDPCSARNLATGSATRSANCTAAGRPAGYDFVYTSSLEIISGGNPNLKAETSDSYTLGAVYTPAGVPGFSLSVDFYNVKVSGVITSVTAQNILNLCYDSATLNNPFCGLFQRAGAAGGPRGEQQFRILEGSLLQSTANFARTQARGIDASIGYRKTFDFGTVNLNAIWTRVVDRSQYTNPADPTRQDVLRLELGDPENQVNFNGSLKVGKFTLGYQLRWIDKMLLNTYEDYFTVGGRNPENADYAEVKFYPEVFYHDLRAQIDINQKFNLYLGVDNVTDTKPPFGLTGVGAGSGIYDVKGRYMYAGFVAKF
jgi:outer membrane receptor protein involved in Fe transport